MCRISKEKEEVELELCLKTAKLVAVQDELTQVRKSNREKEKNFEYELREKENKYY